MGYNFELKLGGVTYTCSPTQYTKGDCDCNIRAEINGMRVDIHIPIEHKVTKVKALLFVEAFHTALTTAIKDQKLDELKYGHHNAG